MTAITGRTLVEAWRQLGREDLIPGDPPSIRLEAERWRTTAERLSFAALGDSGSGGRQAMQVAEQLAVSYRDDPFGVVPLLGDICYYGPISRRFDDVFVAPLRPPIGAGVEFELAAGNHDGGLFAGDPRLAEVEATLELLGTPARYYATPCCPRCCCSSPWAPTRPSGSSWSTEGGRSWSLGRRPADRGRGGRTHTRRRAGLAGR